MTHPLYRDDAYLRDASATVTGHTAEGGIILDASVFFPTGGGQPGDSGILRWNDTSLRIATALKGPDGAIILVPAEPAALPALGQEVGQSLDWERRHRHMRVHTALHLLSKVVPFGVTGGAVDMAHGRLDFNMPEALEDKDRVQQALTDLIALDAAVTEDWITWADLDAAPELVKTLTVQPPRDAGPVRLICIGDRASPIDLQPCGGTHVATLGEIGRVRLGKVQKKGQMNRRIYLHLDN
ncbi:MAG: alanyl-tRNA editing protein [Sulfitobacter sp.]